jgi:hypothetical protein
MQDIFDLGPKERFCISFFIFKMLLLVTLWIMLNM